MTIKTALDILDYVRKLEFEVGWCLRNDPTLTSGVVNIEEHKLLVDATRRLDLISKTLSFRALELRRPSGQGDQALPEAPTPEKDATGK